MTRNTRYRVTSTPKMLHHTAHRSKKKWLQTSPEKSHDKIDHSSRTRKILGFV